MSSTALKETTSVKLDKKAKNGHERVQILTLHIK